MSSLLSWIEILQSKPVRLHKRAALHNKGHLYGPYIQPWLLLPASDTHLAMLYYKELSVIGQCSRFAEERLMTMLQAAAQARSYHLPPDLSF